MFALVALALVAVPTAEVDPKPQAVLHFIRPGNRDSPLRIGAVVDAADRVAGPLVGLRVQSGEQAGLESAALDRCPSPTRFSCWVRLARGAQVSHLIAIAVHGGQEREHRVRAMLVDVSDAATILDTRDRDRVHSEEDAEAAIYEQVLRAPEARVDLESSEALTSFFAVLFRREWQSSLMQESVERGSITIDGLAPRWVVSVDGRNVAVTSAAEQHLTRVSPGPRALAVTRTDGSVGQAVLRVESGKIVRWTVPPPARMQSKLRPIARYGGVTAIAAAGVLGVTAAIAAGAVPQGHCLRRGAAGACDADGFRSFGAGAAGPTTDPTAVNPSGLLIAPLAMGLGAAGATWIAGSYIGDDADAPWWGVLGGVVLGAAVYGIAHVAGDPR